MYSLIGALQTPAGKGDAPRDDAHRVAMEQYLAEHHRARLTDDGFWRLATVQSLAPRLRPTAEAVARAHPRVDPAALAQAETRTAEDRARFARRYQDTVAPQLWVGALISGVSLVGMAAAVPIVLQLVCVLGLRE
jgi:hypothetical protein